jgi:hypothetical protein
MHRDRRVAGRLRVLPLWPRARLYERLLRLSRASLLPVISGPASSFASVPGLAGGASLLRHNQWHERLG